MRLGKTIFKCLNPFSVVGELQAVWKSKNGLLLHKVPHSDSAEF